MMPREHQRTARIEARIAPEALAVVKHAAELQGRSLSDFVIEALRPDHDRAGFCCGVEALDRYFEKQVTQDVRRRATACYVALEVPGTRIAGYYTLAAAGVPLAEMPVELAKRLPRDPSVPV